tara:strand:- start:9301 stop:10251 length:951 start_codon:yes stop_codon:yes gene_type:complete
MKKLLVVRNDRLGDVMLGLPALKMIKSSAKDIHIDYLVNKKYADIASISEHINDSVYDDGDLLDVLKEKKYDYSISLYSTFEIGYMLWKAKIKKRYAPATKIAQIFYNKKIKQRRSQSIKPEYEYNNDLVKFFLDDNKYKIIDKDVPYINLKSINNESNKNKTIYIHPFTGGSSKTLSINDFVNLCYELNKYQKYKFVLHCDNKDYEKCKIIEKKMCNLLHVETIQPTDDLKTMFTNISKCDVFISGSTGPLHVAASLNLKTVGFYPSKKSSTSLRWETMNDKNNKLFFEDMDVFSQNIQVDIQNVAAEIYSKLLK